MSKPQISVIIPAYNCAKYIGLAIDSALHQKKLHQMFELEILVINDCSPDNLDSVMEQYKGNPMISYLKNEKNMGAAKTRNKGVNLAKGEYVAFLDGDDYWAEDKLIKQLEVIQKTKDVLCAAARELITPEGAYTGRIIPVKPVITYKDLLKHNSINCSSVLIKTEVAKEFPMHHEESHEDYIMWLEVLQKYKKACAVNEPLLKYRLSKNGKSGSKWKSARMTFQVYRYVGFSLPKSCIYFVSYAFCGVKKYFFSKMEHKK